MFSSSILQPGAILDSCSPINWECSLNKGLIAEYAGVGVGGSTFRNLCGGILGTIQGLASPTYLASQNPLISSVNFKTASSTRVSLGAPASLNLSAYSIHCLVQFSSTAGTQYLVSNIKNTTTSAAYEIRLSSGTISATYVGDSSSTSTIISGATSLNPSVWYIVSFTKNNQTSPFPMNVYINGLLDGSGTSTIVSPTTYQTVFLGQRGGLASSRFGGQIGQILFYNREMPAGEISSLTSEILQGNPNRWNWFQGWESQVNAATATGNRRRRLLILGGC